MNQSWKTVTGALFLGYLTVSTGAIADPLKTTPDGKSSEEIVAAYRDADLVDAREVAEADHRYALVQLRLARAEFKRLISEIKIEGAEDFDIGGEVRAARMTEAAWQRAVDAVADYLTRLDSMIAGR
jgi:hypothetical protein